MIAIDPKFPVHVLILVLVAGSGLQAATAPAFVSELRPDGQFLIRTDSARELLGAAGEIYYNLTANGVPRTVIVAEFKVTGILDDSHVLAAPVQQRGQLRKDQLVRFFPPAPAAAAAPAGPPASASQMNPPDGPVPPPPATQPPAPAAAAANQSKPPASPEAIRLESFLARMVHIPGGVAEIGLDVKKALFWSETPAHDITLESYYLDRYEVSNQEYAVFVQATGRPAPASWPGGDAPAGGGLLPVTGVTWQDAAAYAKWSHKRLPTEAEWEFAGRGPNRRLYPWGDSFKEHTANLAGANAASPWPVDAGPGDRSHFGVQNLAGNVSEWTQSTWGPYPGNHHTETYIESFRVVRGGACTTPPKYARLPFRAAHPENFCMSDLGFRTAISEKELQDLLKAGLLQVSGAH